MADNIKIVGNIVSTTTVSRYNESDTNLIPSKKLTENFGGTNDYIEFYVYDIAGNLLNTNYNYLSYKLPANTGLTPGVTTQPNTTGNIQTTNVGIDSTLASNTGSLYPIIEIDPVADLQNLGYSSGEFKTRYNFFQNKLSNYINEALFIKEISPDRTELRLASITLTNDEIESVTTSLIKEIDDATYYVDYLLNFGGNDQVVAVNVALNKAPEGYEVLFKLYQPLSLSIQEKQTLWVVEEIVSPYVFDINLDKLIIPPPPPTLRGPNFDIKIPNQGTISTVYTDYSTSLLSLQSLQSSSYYQILNLMATQSIQINIDYTNFDNFVFFGSAYQRLSNFYTKVKQIEDYTNLISAYTPYVTTTGSLQTEINLYSASINNLVSQFDGYETYLYFESSSYTWPKTSSTKPFTLLSTSSAAVNTWYNNLTSSAKDYDELNYDNLVYAVPNFIRDDENNSQYLVFLNMVGQYFDNIWIYLKAITDINLANNNLNKGISKDLVYQQLQSLGIKLYNSQAGESVDQFLIGANTGSSTWDDNFTITGSYLNNIPRKDLVSELYKRIYHNLPLLLKQKGTVAGLDNLMTVFGVPNETYYTVTSGSINTTWYTPTGSAATSSILNVKEFGGSLKSNLVKGYNNDKVRIIENKVTGSVLSPILSLQTFPTSSDEFRENDMHYVDISFSPETQMDTYISGAITSNNPTWRLDDYIGDPRQQYSGSYPDLDAQRKLYFQTGVAGYAPFTASLLDYNKFIRLIEFFDNSLFKMLGDFVPERASLSTGVTINSPVLERNKAAYSIPYVATQSVYDARYTPVSMSAQYGQLYTALQGDKKPFFTGELSSSRIDINQYFTDNYNPYLGDWSVWNAQHTATQSINLNTFLHSDWNVLLNNVSSSVQSRIRKNIEYVWGTTSSIVKPAELQDSYLSLRSYNTSRYEGSRLTSRYYNTYTSASYTGSNGFSIQNGDKSYGKTAVIDQYVRKMGLFTSLTNDAWFNNKTDSVLKYLVDEFGGLTELNKKNKHWEEVQNTFKAGNNQIISLFDNQQYSNQKRSDGTKTTFNSGYSYTPLFYYSNTDRTASFEYAGTSRNNMFKYETNGGSLGLGSSFYYQIDDLGDGTIKNIFGISDVQDYNDNNLYVPGYTSSGCFGYYDISETGYYGFSLSNLKITTNIFSPKTPQYYFYTTSSYGTETHFSSSNFPKSVANLDGSVPTRYYTSGSRIYFGIERLYSGAGTPVESINAGAVFQSTLSNGVPYALSPFTSSITTTQFCLDEQFAVLYGYLFLPQGYGSYPSSSLYPTYGDVDYSFTVSPGDFIKFILNGISYEFEIASTTVTQGTAGTGSVCFNINGIIPNALVGSFGSVNTVLVLKKLQDETNVILSYAKPSGSTSYGFLIPENLSPEVLANIDTITQQVKTKLIGNQPTIIGSIDGGGF